MSYTRTHSASDFYKEAFDLTTFRYYLPPHSKLPQIVGILAFLLCANTAYLLIRMPSYTQYFDYWATLVAGFLLGITCMFFIRKRTELVLIPTGIFALIACLSPSLIHWTEVILFFLLLILLLVKLPAWVRILARIIGVVTAGVGILAILIPVIERIERLSQVGRADASFVIPYIIRTLGGDVLCLLSMLLLIFALRPHVLPGWMDENDKFDRIWE